MSHAGHDHATKLASAGAGAAHAGHDHAAHAASSHDHSLPPGVVALSGAELVEACALAAAEDPRGALDLRIAAIFVIAIGSAIGMFLPLLLQRWRAFDKNRAPFFVLKAFGAGVILATGIIHMYPAANSALSSPCLGWPEFPWAGMITTFGIIGFLLLEHGVTSLVEARLHAKLRALAARGVPSSSSWASSARGLFASSSGGGSGSRKKPCCEQAASASKLGDAESGGKGGVHGHEHHHSHSHGAECETSLAAAAAATAAAAARTPPHTDACCPPSPELGTICGGSGDLSIANVHGPALAHSHGHKHGGGTSKEGEVSGGGGAAAATSTALAAPAAAVATTVDSDNSLTLLPTAGGEDCDVALRHAAVAQVLEFGIAMHSFIIGIALGVSREAAEIKPLLVAITFHQCFEGIALGSCLIEAEYGKGMYAALGVFYSLTTASGVALGIGIASSYNPGSKAALGISGVLDAISAAILIYAALVDLIAADFLTKRFRADRRLQVGGYCALLLGAGLMSLIAIWA